MSGWLFLLGLSAVAHAGDCSEASELASLEAATAQVAAAFKAQDLAGMQSAQAESEAELSCLREPISAPVAAQVHEVLALAAFTEGQRERVLAELYAAHQLGGIVLISEAVVAGHPLRQLSDEAAARPRGEGAPVASPDGVPITVDGAAGGLRAPGAAAVVQRYTGERVTDTLLLAPGEALPGAPAWPKRRAILLSATGAAALSAAVVYSQSWQSNNAFWDTGAEALPDNALEAQLRKTNTQAGAAIGLAGGAAVLGVVTVVTW